jgi:hypothetical protein
MNIQLLKHAAANTPRFLFLSRNGIPVRNSTRIDPTANVKLTFMNHLRFSAIVSIKVFYLRRRGFSGRLSASGSSDFKMRCVLTDVGLTALDLKIWFDLFLMLYAISLSV